MKKSLYEMALDTELHSNIIARSDDLNRPLTDVEMVDELEYQLEDIPHKSWETSTKRKAIREVKRLLKVAEKRGL